MLAIKYSGSLEVKEREQGMAGRGMWSAGIERDDYLEGMDEVVVRA